MTGALEPPAVRAPRATATGAGAPLRLTGIEKRWGGRPVLAGVDLTVAAGSIAWVGGSNGAGKTTLLRIAAGLIDPDAGAVSAFGLTTARERRAYQAALGFLAAGDRGLYARLTVGQNLDFAAALALIPRTRRRVAVGAALARFGLEELLRRRVDRLSMGQRQRVRLAMATVHEPRLLLLDEPHTSLDGAGLDLLAAALEAVAARGGAVVWCAPEIDRSRLRVDAAHKIEHGRVIAA